MKENLVNPSLGNSLQVYSRESNMEKLSINDWFLEMINIQREAYGACTSVTLNRTVSTLTTKRNSLPYMELTNRIPNTSPSIVTS